MDRASMVVSEVLIAELLDVLSRPKFSSRIARIGLTVSELIAMHRNPGEVIEAVDLIEAVSRDKDDDAILAYAISGRVDVIVSGDSDLLDIGQFRGIPILTAPQFLLRL